MRVTEPEDKRPFMALYKATIDEAVGASGSLILRLVAHVRSELRELESQARDRRERERLTDSRRLLNQHEATLSQRFTEELLTAFTRQSSIDRVVPDAGALQFVQVGSMDDQQLQRSVDAARVKQSVLHAADGALDELSGLICTLLGLPEVRLERNPLRPAVYVETVTAALSHLPVPPAMRLAWISMMSKALGHELDIYYHSLCTDLRERGVVSVASGPGADSATGSASGRAAQSKVVVTLERLRHLLHAAPVSRTQALAERFHLPGVTPDSDSAFAASQPVVPTGFRSTVPAAFDALADMQQLDQAVHRLEGRRLGDGSHTSDRLGALDTLRRSVQGLDQALGLEVVAMMVENITHDPRLLGPVRQLVADLEPALWQLALVDPRFFSHKDHPARRLLHEITHRSIAFESVDSRGFSDFMAPLREAVAPLADASVDTAEPFDQALDRFVATLDDAHGRGQRRFGKAVQALRQAEQRNILAETIVAEVQARADAQRVPPAMLAFLCGPWAQVVAHARITDTTGADDPGEYAQTIDDLLWIVQPDLTAAKPAASKVLAPMLKARLQHGLASIAFAAEDGRAFLQVLEQTLAGAPGAQSGNRPDAGAAVTAPVSASDSLWLAPTEAQASGFIDLSTEVQALAPTAAVNELVVGVWVALFAEGGWTRTCLSWRSPKGSLLLFTDALGLMQTLGRRACQQLLAAGHLRVVSNDLVEDALDVVAQTAARNSVDIRF
ncbi:MAG: DUF1631 domain-containing protein [Rhodoferax sp.]|nr:DUF1631 domain-containing protein [Rhodoferax sp.]